MRVTSESGERIYDFGRYRRTWGTGDSEGDGILRVWTNGPEYIKGENATGRTTTGFVYPITQEQAAAVNGSFDAKIAGKKGKADPRGRSMTEYQLDEDYHATKCTCTTQTVDGAKIAEPTLFDGSAPFNTGEGVVGWKEKTAMKVKGIAWPSGLWVPNDVRRYLESPKATISPQKTNTYKK